MSPPDALMNHLHAQRERAGLSQQALADRVGVSRQAINAIEGGRQVPSTHLALRLARALGCTVEALFALPEPAGLAVTLANPGTGSRRVLLGRVQGRWVAHAVAADPSVGADGLLAATHLRAEPLRDPDDLARRVLVAGCAPLLGLLAARPAAGVSWLAASTGRALDLLAGGLVHVAGLHAHDPASAQANLDLLAARFAGRAITVIHLTRWRQGLLTGPGNPLGLHALSDLGRTGLRFARRAPGAGASRLVSAVLDGHVPSGPLARGHAEVARLVQVGAADAGVAIEAVALAAGLHFVPLSEERFDLAVPTEMIDDPRLVRLVEQLTERRFLAEARTLAGYDLGLVGQVQHVGQAA